MRDDEDAQGAAEAGAAEHIPGTVPGAPPRAAVRPHSVASPHGARIDPYYWLRDDERRDAEVLDYLKAENAYKERALAPVKKLRDKLYAEIIGRLNRTMPASPISRMATGTSRASSRARSTPSWPAT